MSDLDDVVARVRDAIDGVDDDFEMFDIVAYRETHSVHSGLPHDLRVADLRALLAAYESAVRERDEARALHHDLLYQVGKVTPGETRHESARRIIRHHEEHCGQGGPSVALEAPDAS